MRRLFPIVVMLMFSLPSGAQTSQPAAVSVPAVKVTAAETAKFEPLLERSLRVVVGSVTKIDAAAHTVEIKSSAQIYERDTVGGFVSGFAVTLSENDTLKAAQEGVFFVEADAGGKSLKCTFFGMEQKDVILAVAERWLDRQVAGQLKALEAAYKDDPDGDKPASVAAARRMYALGLNQMYFPTYKNRTAENPARGRLAELFQIVHADLGIPAYIKTAEDKAKAVEVLKNAGEKMISSAAARAATRPFPDSDFDEMTAYFLYTRFSVFSRTLAAEDARFQSDLGDFVKQLPEIAGKPTRMKVFRALLAMQLQGKK